MNDYIIDSTTSSIDFCTFIGHEVSYISFVQV